MVKTAAEKKEAQLRYQREYLARMPKEQRSRYNARHKGLVKEMVKFRNILLCGLDLECPIAPQNSPVSII